MRAEMENQIKFGDRNSNLLVLELDRVGEKHRTDIAGVGARDLDDRGLGKLVEDPRRLWPERERERHRRLRLHLEVPRSAARRRYQLLRFHFRSDRRRFSSLLSPNFPLNSFSFRIQAIQLRERERERV